MNRKYGCLYSPTDLRDYKPYGLYPNESLPDKFKLSNSLIKDQGDVNSCVAHALSSMLEIKLNTDYSTGWIYGYRPEGYYQGMGMYPRDALKTLLNVGAVEDDDFSYNYEMPDAKRIVDDNLSSLTEKANKYKINAYVRLNSIEEIKSWIYSSGNAVPIAIATNDLQLDENNIIQIPDTYPSTGHAMLIIGWNELGFVIQNSWGENWGDKGLAILPYEYVIKEAWGVTLSENQTQYFTTKPSFHFIRKLLQSIVNLFLKRR